MAKRKSKRAKRVAEARKASKLTSKKKSPHAKQPRKASTPNGKMIQDLMDKREVRGSYKDFVVIAGNRLIDWTNSWDIFSPTGDTIGFEGVVLLHKSKLADLIGEKMASKVWDPKLKRRVQAKQSERNPNQAKASN